jgi:hypothetical protein
MTVCSTMETTIMMTQNSSQESMIFEFAVAGSFWKMKEKRHECASDQTRGVPTNPISFDCIGLDNLQFNTDIFRSEKHCNQQSDSSV